MASYLAVGLRQFEAYSLKWRFLADIACVEFIRKLLAKSSRHTSRPAVDDWNKLIYTYNLHSI